MEITQIIAGGLVIVAFFGFTYYRHRQDLRREQREAQERTRPSSAEASRG